MAFSGLSIVLPAYNEAENIQKVLESALRIIRDVGGEVLVVDDGSDDQTAELVTSYPSSQVRLVRHSHNRGYGAALRSGFGAARYDWIFFTDADGQFNLQQIYDLISHSQSYDLVVGFRAQRKDPNIRLLNAWVWAKLVNTTFGLSIVDVNCAFKLIRADSLRSITLFSEGACINAEMFVKLLERGARLKQVPVEHFPRSHGRQTGARPDVILRALRELISLRAGSDNGVRKP
ncbi:MAG: glycosyltransferase family 2 protein [Myxococcota bacterium]|nr:glycosyltransferase family 2 protein [Myxococcota bacterium]